MKFTVKKKTMRPRQNKPLKNKKQQQQQEGRRSDTEEQNAKTRDI